MQLTICYYHSQRFELHPSCQQGAVDNALLNKPQTVQPYFVESISRIYPPYLYVTQIYMLAVRSRQKLDIN
jgi:hypothetical protein